MKMLFEDVTEITDGIWRVIVDPTDISIFGTAKSVYGDRSVLLATQPEYDSVARKLSFERSNALLLNLGSGSDTLIFKSTSDPAQPSSLLEDGGTRDTPAVLGQGDNQFLKLVDSELRGEANMVAKRLLQKVRDIWPGDLKKGIRNNFSNTPDNFWYVVVQPRVQELSITVRGRPTRFQASKIELKDDRPGYTRFKLAKLSDLDSAFDIISQSTRHL